MGELIVDKKIFGTACFIALLIFPGNHPLLAGEGVTVEVDKILASHVKGREELVVDKELSGLVKEWEKLPFNFNTYKLLGTEKKNGSFKETLKFKLPKDHTLKIICTKVEERIQLNFEIDRGKIKSQTRIIEKGKFMLVGGGIKLEEGTLILFLSAWTAESE